MTQDLDTGQHRNDTENPDYFTTSFFHHPDEFRNELAAAGFPQANLYGIEGPVWTIAEPQSAEERESLMAIMRTLETDPTLLGASAHIMAVAKR